MRLALLAAAASMLVSMAPRAAEIETLAIGLTANGTVINAMHVGAGRHAAPAVALVGGLEGADASSRAVRDELAAYAAKPDAERGFELFAVPVANPEKQPLVFPPTGPAYREHAESHVIWRWLGLHAPDLVLVVRGDSAAAAAAGAGAAPRLAAALAGMDVAGVAPIPSRVVSGEATMLAGLSAAALPPSPAHVEIERRRARTPQTLANLLAPIYGQNFDPPIYIDGMGLIAQLELGHLDRVEALVEPYVDGKRDSLGGRFGTSSLVLAGHLVFAELAERTHDPRYLARARAAADLAFTPDGRMREAMPGHGEMSDSIFMGASILAAVGHLTGERRYFDMAARHIAFMNALVHRDDGLYRHSPLTDAAWGRGNGFAAIGYALTLSKLPADHPARARLLREYRALMATLARWQNADGTWRQVIDQPGAYHETSATAIIGFAIQRGLNRGWLAPSDFEEHAARAFRAVSVRTDESGGFIDVSESTNKQPSLEAYLKREALFGRDRRTGSFAMLFAVERAKADGKRPKD